MANNQKIANLGIGITISTSGTAKALKQLKKDVKNAVADVAKIFSAVSAAMATMTVAAFKELEEAQSDLIKGGDRTAQELAKSFAQVNSIAGSVGKSYSDIAKIVDTVNDRLKSGTSALVSTSVSKAISAMSNLTGVAGDTLAKDLIPTLTLFGVTAQEMPNKLAYLEKATAITGTSLTDVAQVFKSYTKDFKALGLSFEETVTLLTQAEKKGVSMEQIGASLKKFSTGAVEAVKASSPLTTQLKALEDGVSAAAKAVSIAQGKVRSTSATINGKQVTTTTGTGDVEIAQENYNRQIAALKEFESQHKNELDQLNITSAAAWKNFTNNIIPTIDPYNKAALAAELFGSKNANVITVIQQLVPDLKKLGEQNKQTLKELLDAAGKVDIFSQAWANFKSSFVVGITPLIGSQEEFFKALIENVGYAGELLGKLTVDFVKWVSTWESTFKTAGIWIADNVLTPLTNKILYAITLYASLLKSIKSGAAAGITKVGSFVEESSGETTDLSGYASGASFQVPSSAASSGGQDGVNLAMAVDPGEFVSVSRTDPYANVSNGSGTNSVVYNITNTVQGMTQTELQKFSQNIVATAVQQVADEAARQTTLGKKIRGTK